MIKSILDKVVFITLGIVLFATTSYGVNSNVDCGPGKTFAQSDNAVITVNISSSTTYAAATTSSTSGCEGPFVAHNATQLYLVHNYEQISEEMAKGQGMYLEALANMMGCSTKANQYFSRIIQKAYPALISSEQDVAAKAKHLIQKIKVYIRADSQLSQLCQIS